MRRPVLAVLLTLISRCSLSVGNFEIPPCRSQSDCDVLNSGASACARYICVISSRRCVQSVDADGDGDRRVGCGGSDCDDGDPRRSSRAAEVCDGIDNDCNQVIDEGMVSAASVSSVARVGGMIDSLFLTGNAARSAVSWRDSSSGRASFASLRNGSIEGSVVSDVGFLRNASDDLAQPISLISGCVGVGSCSASEIALDAARDGRDWFAAAVNVAGCAAGDLRVGYVRSAGAEGNGFVAIGPAARGASAAGFGPCVGASRPVVVRLPDATATPQALLAWLESPQGASRCGESASLKTVGMWLEGGSSAVPWVNTTNAGAPQVVGAVLDGSSPAVVSWSRADRAVGFGWFLAAAEPSGDLRVRYLPPLGEPPAFSAALPPGTARATPPLRLESESTLIPTAGQRPTTVSMSVGPLTPRGVLLGLAWVDRCGDGDVFFAQVRFMAGAASSVGTFSVADPVRLSSRGRASSSAIAWVDDGFVTMDFVLRSDDDASVGRGGWMITWIEGGRLMGRRVLGSSGHPIDESALELREGPMLEMPQLFGGDSGAALRGLWFNRATSQVEVGTFSCR